MKRSFVWFRPFVLFVLMSIVLSAGVFYPLSAVHSASVYFVPNPIQSNPIQDSRTTQHPYRSHQVMNNSSHLLPASHHLTSTTVLSATEPVSPTDFIDLNHDDNGDGIPDELHDDYSVVIDLLERDGYTDEFRDALADLNARLPYTDETRALQEQTDNLMHELMTTKDGTRHLEIIAQLEALEAQKMQDPTYIRIVNAKVNILTGATRTADEPLHQHHEQTAPAQTNTSVFLPLISKKNDDGGQGAPPAGWNPLRGDVLLVDGAGSSSGIGWTDFLYQVWWGHSGMYDGNDRVYESVADGVNLRLFTPNWLRRGDKIWHGRTLNEETRSKVVASLDAAKAKYGIDGTTPYNANYLDKITEEKFYCSQLVWRIHQGAGIDVDSNDSRYSNALAAKWAGRLDPIIVNAIALAAVAPDELYLDTDLQRVLEFTVQ